jgi:Ser/Thr protein kinase RdoA (MazF antagonist)
MMPRVSDRWLDGSTRPGDVDAAALEAVVARVLGSGASIERAPGGVSTAVYRVDRDGEVVFVRVAEQPGGSMEVEAAVHARLRTIGVTVPEVLALDDGVDLGRGLMILREIPGRPLVGSAGVDPTPVLRAAGADLARINGVEVDGFGWIRRDGAAPPFRGVHASYRAFVEEGTQGIQGAAASALDARQGAVLSTLLEAVAAEEREARLAHGDFDGTHIYQHAGAYSGLIDLGEMRGAEPWYDLAFALVQDRSAVTALVAGYREVAPVPEDLSRRLLRSATVIVATQLGRWIVRDGPDALERPSGRWWTSRLRELVDEVDSDGAA